MMRKPTTVDKSIPFRVAVITLDQHLGDATNHAGKQLAAELPGLNLTSHAAVEWDTNDDLLTQCREDIAQAHLVVVTMIFMEEHIQAILPALRERRDACDAMICCLSAPEIVKLTRMGRFTMDGKQSGPMALLKRLRGNSKKSGASAGAQQLTVLRQLPRILRFIPGTAQDLRAYFLTLQYSLAGSEPNFIRMIKFLTSRYADGPRTVFRSLCKEEPPISYPDTGVYHPRMKQRMAENVSKLPRRSGNSRGTVGLLIMRSYVLAGNTAHYDAVIEAFEARGLSVITAFAMGLDARPAIDRFFMKNDVPTVDAIVSLTGFSLVGGPAYNDALAAETILAKMNVPYLSATPVELQTIEEWESSERGLLPVEATMMVAIPELEGATGTMVYAGCSSKSRHGETRNMRPLPERIDRLTARVAQLVSLRKTPAEERRLAVVLFNFPPNAANVGTAAHLDVFASLYNTLEKLSQEGYSVELPADVDTLRREILEGNASQYGTDANVHMAMTVDDYVRNEKWLEEIENQWGPAPGRLQSNGKSIFVLGKQFGNIFVGVQPGFGYEGDPMRLLFESGFAPTHAFAAFYSYIRESFDAHAVLHFGTHGALEFMPGKQAGLSQQCWPDRLIRDLPNFYLYALNNPSEGLIAKRRSAATLISYLTPTIARAGLYRGLADLKHSIERWRADSDSHPHDRVELAELIQTQAAAIDLVEDQPFWRSRLEERINELRLKLLEVESTLVPMGLHIIGQGMAKEERVDLLQAMFETKLDRDIDPSEIAQIIDCSTINPALANKSKFDAQTIKEIQWVSENLAQDHELDAIVNALNGSYVRPAPGGDLIANSEVLPSGRNIHGFDPFRLPSQFALLDGERQARQLLERHRNEGNRLPESIALVLWGTDNLKTEGTPLSQALALIGARPRLDSYGRVCGASLIPLEELGRPRIDVVMTLSGIFRDLLPLQTRLLAEAALLAAQADEPLEANFVRKHALVYQQANGCDLETAALRVFSNAEGAYGSNVNLLIDNGLWDDEDELAATYTQRKCFAYDHKGRPAPQAKLLEDILSGVELAYQNLDSVELGVTSIDHYFDTLGGVTRAVHKATGNEIPVYISDQTGANGKVRTLAEQLSLETRSRILNPKWHESILTHGYEGVREIEAHITNTVGWSATTGQVEPWVYQQFSETFVLDEAMRDRLSLLNPAASLKLANRLLEARDRQYWNPDSSTLDALVHAAEELEDRLEGITNEVAA
jgi:magnesium chelatase subunit H